MKIFLKLPLESSSGYNLTESLAQSFCPSKCQTERECDLHDHLFRKHCVVHCRIRCCRDVMKILPTLTKDNIIFFNFLSQQEITGTTGNVYLYNRPHISLLRNINEIIICQWDYFKELFYFKMINRLVLNFKMLLRRINMPYCSENLCCITSYKIRELERKLFSPWRRWSWSACGCALQ